MLCIMHAHDSSGYNMSVHMLVVSCEEVAAHRTSRPHDDCCVTTLTSSSSTTRSDARMLHACCAT